MSDVILLYRFKKMHSQGGFLFVNLLSFLFATLSKATALWIIIEKIFKNINILLIHHNSWTTTLKIIFERLLFTWKSMSSVSNNIIWNITLVIAIVNSSWIFLVVQSDNKRVFIFEYMHLETKVRKKFVNN